MRRFAEGTKVPPERSREELERLLRRAGATGFVTGWDADQGVDRLIFRLQARMIRIEVIHPRPEDFRLTPKRIRRTTKQAEEAAEQEYRRRWRAQVLLAKAKLEVIADGLSTVEREFLADMLLPNGETIAEAFLPRLAEAYEAGTMPSLPLLGPGAG